jgi:TolB-like protein/Tfp pilus assembly protein PilF
MSGETGKRRMAAVLAADVAGYSRLMGADEEATIAALGRARAVFREQVSTRNGRVVDTAGDSVLSVFESIIEAVRCALAVQETLAARNADVPEDRRMCFRIGIHFGDIVEQNDGTVYGDGVNIAARLESLADPGGVMISDAAHMHVRRSADVVFSDAGEHDVKNIARPVRAYRILVNGQAESAEPPKSLPLPDKPSIAVLPFDNLSGDPEQEYFVDGIAEDLITAFSRMRWLSVTARNSTFSYKGQSPDVRQVGRELGVRYVLEGSVRKGGNRVRISAQLIDATDGNHLWAQRYDRELEDIFDVQDEITLTIAGAIEPELAQIERERARRKPAENLDAWDLCQRGLWHLWQFTKDDNEEAQRLFNRAFVIEPRLAAARAHLSFSHFLDSVMGYSDAPQKSIALAEAAAKQAIAIDDKDAMAHSTLGRILTTKGDNTAAIEEQRAAIDLNPSFAMAHYGLGLALTLRGQAAEAVPEFEMASRLSPHDTQMWLFETLAAIAHILLGQFEIAEQLARSAIRRPGAGLWAHAALATVLGRVGRVEEARKSLAKLLELKPDFSQEWFESILIGVDPSFTDAIFEGLYKAGLEATKNTSAAAD